MENGKKGKTPSWDSTFYSNATPKMFGCGVTPPGPMLVLQSPNTGDQSLFDKPSSESFSDVVVPLPSDKLLTTSSLALHRCILSRTSSTLAKVLLGQPQFFQPCKLQGNQICGLFDPLDSDERAAMLDWLRFGYGFDVTVTPSSAPAVLALLLRLQIVGKDDLREKLETFMVGVAQRNYETGIDMLQKCLRYWECHTKGFSRVDLRLAKCVFTLANLNAHSDKIKACLMGLQIEHLKEVQYGPQGSPNSEYALRKEYFERHKGALTMSQRKCLLAPCNFQQMKVEEVDELMDMCQLNDTEKMQLYRLAFASCRGETDIKDACLSLCLTLFCSVLLLSRGNGLSCVQTLLKTQSQFNSNPRSLQATETVQHRFAAVRPTKMMSRSPPTLTWNTRPVVLHSSPQLSPWTTHSFIFTT